MQVRTQFFAIFIISFGLLPLGIAGCGSSDPPNAGMVYTFAGAASGSLGALTFTDAPFTLVVAADTRAVTPSTESCAVPEGVCHLLSVPATSVRFSLAQQNVTATFTSSAGMFVNQTYSSIGLQRLVNQTDAIDIQGQAFATYDLKTAIGPVGSLTGVLGQFNCNFGCIETNMGVLTMDSVAGVTFAASSAP